MRPPVCEICDGDVDPAGGLVRFQPDDRSRAWRHRAETEPGFVGHPPDTGWFCGDHIEAARTAALTCSFADGVRLVAAGPEVAPSAAIGGDDERWMEWPLDDIDAHALAGSLLAAVPALFEALLLGAAPAMVTRSERSWNPMDGALPPWCPFTDTTIHEGIGDDGAPISLQVVLNHWNDDEVASASVSMSIEGHLWITAFGSDAGGRTVCTLRLQRPAAGAVVEVVEQLRT